MAFSSFTCYIIIHLLLLVIVKCSTASVPEEPRFNTLIEGYVYCSKSNMYTRGNQTHALADATPLTGAGVSLNCSSLIQNSTTTKDKGYFSISTPKPMSYAEVEECKVYLSSSPDENCNIPTDVNGGLSGAVLQLITRQHNNRTDEVIKITVGPFAFRSAEWKTTYNLQPQEEHGEEYCDIRCIDCVNKCCLCTNGCNCYTV